MKARVLLTLAALAVAACSQPAPQVPPVTTSPSPSSAAPQPSASASSAAPSPAASATPAAPTGLGLGEGEALKPYGFNWIDGIYRDEARDQLYVVDAQNKTDTPRRYLVRKFQMDGTFISTISLTPEGGEVPDAIDGIAFDQRGIQFFNYREDETFRLMKLITAAVVPVNQTDHPLSFLDRAGPSALAPDDAEMLVAAVNLTRDGEAEREQEEVKGGQLTVGRAEEGEAPTLLFNIPDPLEPTVRMAFSPEGDLFLAGPNKQGQQALVRVKQDRSVATVATGFPAVPDRLVFAPSGDVVLAFDSTTSAAALRLVGPNGEAKGEASLTLKDNGYLTTVQGVTFDAEGRMIVAGRGFNGARETVSGLFRFGRLAP